MNWPRAIIHLDMDTFFVSVERKHDPSLIGKPVIVGGGRDGQTKRGVVAACSYETRKFGVRSAMPLAQALRLCPDAILVPPGRSDYGAETARVREAISTFTDLFEMTSPDEAYIDLKGTDRLWGPPIEAADRLRRRIREGVGLPVSVGLATSKHVAKIASKLSKPQGMFAVLPGGEAAILRPFPIRTLPGLGPKTETALHRRGVRTLGELAATPEARLIDWLGDHGASLARRARGEPGGEIEPDRDRAQISAERTFADDIGDPDRLHTLLAQMTTRIGAQLRKRGEWAGTVTLKLRYPDFTTLTRQAPLAPPSHDDPELLRAARALLEKVWDKKRPLRLLGVGVSGMVEAIQPDLLGVAEGEKRERLLSAIDAIRKPGARGAISWGAALDQKSGKPRNS